MNGEKQSSTLLKGVHLLSLGLVIIGVTFAGLISYAGMKTFLSILPRRKD